MGGKSGHHPTHNLCWREADKNFVAQVVCGIKKYSLTADSRSLPSVKLWRAKVEVRAVTPRFEKIAGT